MRRATVQVQARPLFVRPFPSRSLLETEAGLFVPAPEVVTSMRELFISESGPFYDPTHSHLNGAQLGALWTNNELKIGGSRKAAVALMPRNKGLGKLDKDFWSFMMRMFFRVGQDFLIIFDAGLAAEASDPDWLITLSHELTHCAQEKKGGVPQFHKDTWMPKFAMRPHDREFFVSDLRFGARTVLGSEVVNAVLKSELEGPEVSADYVARMCGTCAQAR